MLDWEIPNHEGAASMTSSPTELRDRLVKSGFSYEQTAIFIEFREEILSHPQNCGLQRTPIEAVSSSLFAGNERNVFVEKRQIADLSERPRDLTRELKDQAFSRKLDQICIITVLVVIVIGLAASKRI